MCSLLITVEPFLAVWYLSKAQCLLDFQRVNGQEYSVRTLSMRFDGYSPLMRLPYPATTFYYSQHDHLNRGPGKLSCSVNNRFEHKTLNTMVAGHTSMRLQGINRRFYTNRQWSTSDYLLYNGNIFSNSLFATVGASALWQEKASTHSENITRTTRTY